MKGVPLIRASAFLPFVGFLEEIGARVDPMLARAGLPEAILAQPEALIPVHQACRFVADAARREGIEQLGSVVGARISLDALGAFGRLVARSLTLRELLYTAVRLHPSYSTGGHLWLEPDVDRTWLRYGQDRRIEHGWQQAEQLSVVLMLQTLRLAPVPAPGPIEIQLRATAAAGLPDDEIFANTRISFGHPATGVAVPRSLLGQALAGPRRASSAWVHLERWLILTGPAADFSGSVRQAVGTLLLDGYPDVRRTASAIGLSVRTLQRRLAASGFSYSRLIEQERFRTAVRLLADPSIKVTNVAIELGYTDLANFTHAFRRWTGVSPSAFRRVE
ncbi:MAG TPA: AraC family transcriptional regulator ligand-binding domain-containing protein [Myxococcota bacterium]|jgi:AraC-like DNA-binding protein